MMIAIAVVGIIISSPPCLEPDDSLGEARMLHGQGRYTESLDRIVAAFACPFDESYRARFDLQRGLAEIELGRRLDALLSFSRSMAADASIDLDRSQHSGIAVSLFECARSLPKAWFEDASLRDSFESQLTKGASCPTIAPPPPAPPEARVVDGAIEPEPPAPPLWPTWIATGVAVAGAGVAIGFGVASLSSADDRSLAMDYPDGPNYTAADERLRRDVLVSNVSWATAGVAAGTAVGLFLWWLLSSDDGSVVANLVR